MGNLWRPTMKCYGYFNAAFGTLWWQKKERDATVKKVINFMAPGYVCTLQTNNCNNMKKSSTRSYQWWLYFDLCECVYVCVKDAKLYYVWENANVLKGCTYLQWWFMTLSIFSILLVQCYRFESSISGLKALAFRVRVNSFSLYVNFLYAIFHTVC